MRRKRSPVTKAMAATETEFVKAGRAIVANIIANNPRLEAARDEARAGHDMRLNVVEESLREFRQRLKK